MSSVPTCPVCGLRSPPGFVHCFCCRLLVRQLRMGLTRAAVIVDFAPGDPTHRLLRRYKDAPVAEARAAAAGSLVDVVSSWWAANRETERSLAPLGTVVVPVPSTRRPGRSPVVLLARGLGLPVVDVLHRSTYPPDHLRASRDGFVVTSGAGLTGRDVIVFEDCLVTGARSQSAAAALRLSGASVRGIVAVGRPVSAATRPAAA